MRRVIVWLTLRMFRVMNQGQGFAGVSVGDDEYKILLSLQRDGLSLAEAMFYTPWTCAGRIVELYKILRPTKAKGKLSLAHSWLLVATWLVIAMYLLLRLLAQCSP